MADLERLEDKLLEVVYPTKNHNFFPTGGREQGTHLGGTTKKRMDRPEALHFM